MNCCQFQNDLYEYLDGALSPEARKAAEQHLSGCAACRVKLEEERQVAHVIGGGFQRATESLELPPAVGHRVLAELARDVNPAREEHGIVLLWRRLAWPLALAASLLLLAGVWVLLPHGPGRQGLLAQHRAAAGETFVQLSYIVPAYTFRLEEGFVIDALSYHTNVINQTLPAHAAGPE
jgi:anti-sigma factor RsiW